MSKENNLLEKALSVAESGYDKAYRFLLNEYENDHSYFGPQTLYFLACLAGGAGLTCESLGWLKTAVIDNGWWYRPEVLEDDDLAEAAKAPLFDLIKSTSDARYTEACSKAKAVFSWEKKSADDLLIAVHGNTQNAHIATEDWKPFLKENPHWQIEAVQSAEPDSYGTYRWSYDMKSYLTVAKAIEKAEKAGYRRIACGGFSAGCDMLLRALAFEPVRCDMLILQSPWIPMLDDNTERLANALCDKNIELMIRCGSEDEDCLPMAKRLYEAANASGVNTTLTVQNGFRHQFPE